MRILRGTSELSPERFRDPVVTIGVFDGVHRGHRVLLAQGREMAARAGGEFVVLTFHIHPRAVTTGDAPALITSLPHRLHLLEREGVDTTVVLHFDDALREMPARQFVEDILLTRIGVRGVALGYDSHFGHNREGGPELLQQLLGPRGIPVQATEAVCLRRDASSAGDAGDVSSCDVPGAGEIVSSSAIRAAVASRDLATAARLLGRPPALFGTVVKGDGRGRQLGIPTANLDLGGELRPQRGVYGAHVTVDGATYAAAVNIGGRPTFYPEDDGADTVEAHLIGFDGALHGDLYGRSLEVVLLGHLRDEQRFDGPDALRAQIERDIAVLLGRIEDGTWRLP